MRVIAGTLRSRTLQAPAGLATRPTSDRLRETLFNVLAARMEGASFLDLYAGSGAVGIEALSRGAARVVCVERAPAALKVLRANLERLGIGGEVRVEAMAVQAYLRKAQSAVAGFGVVFLDPPYEAEAEYEATLALLGKVGSGPGAQDQDPERPTLVIAEHRRKTRLEEQYGLLKRTRLLEQGDAGLSFYEAALSR